MEVKIDISTLKCCSGIPPNTFFYNGKHLKDSIGFMATPNLSGKVNAANCKAYFIDFHALKLEYANIISPKSVNWVDISYLVTEFNSRRAMYEFDGENCRSYERQINLKTIIRAGEEQYQLRLGGQFSYIKKIALVEAHQKYMLNPTECKAMGKTNSCDFADLMGSTTVGIGEYITF